VNLPCILCAMTAEGRGYFGWQHDRQNWTQVTHREAMALTHGLVLAPEGSIRTGPWVPWRDTVRDDGDYSSEENLTGMEEESETR
jgi:hypothetical protein